MTERLAVASLLLLVTACSSPLTVRVERAEAGQQPTVREIEFEDYRLTERENGTFGVWLEHRESFMPWHFSRPYLGEKLGFEFSSPIEIGASMPVESGYYELRAYAPAETEFREGTVTPVAGDAESIGSFRLVFDGVDPHGTAIRLTFTGSLPR